MKKRLLSILLTLLMILGVMPLSVSADTPFTITLHANDSSGATVTSELSSGSIYTVPDDAFTNGKYAIQYWNTQPDNSGFIYYNDEDFTVTENLDLYAQWVLPLAKEEAFEQDGISWSGNGASPFKLTMSDGAVIISSVIFPTDSSNPGIDEIIIEVEGDCEIAGNIGVASNDDLSYAYERANIIITGDGTLKTGIKGTGHGDTLTIDADTEITGGLSIGASGGMDSNLIIKSGKTLTVEEDISLIESLTLESGVKLIVGSNISFHSNPTISLADDAEIHITAENNYMESCVLYKEMGDNSYFEYLEENNWLPKDYYFVDGYLYNDSDEIETEGVIIKKRSNESTIYFEDTDIEPITLPHGATVSAPDDPEKEGHTFLGWDKEIPATMPTEDMTITALWEVNQYTIAFENTGDSVIDDITQDYGTQIAHPDDPVKAGYIFTGWDVQIPSTMPAENMTITATWQEKPLPSVNTDTQTYIYNGSDHEFTVRGDNFTVTYSQNGNPVETPTDAGVYDVSITRPEDEGYAAYEKELTGALVIKSAVITDVEGVSAPEAAKTADSTVSGDHYSGSAQWTPTDSVFDYNTVYSVVIKLTADKNYVFEDGISLDGYEANVTDNGKTLTLTATFEKTAKEKITSITPPSVDKLGAYYDDASDAIASLPPTVEAQAESGKTTLDITWNIIGTYNPAPGAQNSFSWTADIGEYDINNQTASGTLDIPNSDYIGVVHTATPAEITYDGNTFDVSTMFTKDVNAGEESYSIVVLGTEGEGEATLGDDGKTLTITKAGVITVKMTTEASGAYDSGSVETTLTVNRADGDAAVTLEDYTYGQPAGSPVITSTSNPTDNAQILYESTDEGGYSDSIPPVNAGEYKITVTLPETDLYTSAVASDDFTVLKATPVINVLPTTDEITNGDKLGDYPINGGEARNDNDEALEGSFSWQTPDKRMASSGKNTVKVVFTPLDSKNYNTATAEITVSVTSGSNRVVLITPYYDVMFDTNGAGKMESQSVRRFDRAQEPEAPEKDGFTFGGWYTDRGCTNKYDFDNEVTRSFTLFAKWVEEGTHHTVCDGTAAHDCPSLRFDDLDVSKWYHLDTDYVIANDIFRGTYPTIFEPHSPITRAMMITVIYRAEGEPEVEGSATFTDIDTDEYYAKAVVWGQQNGIIKGYSAEEFRPDEPIIREQISAIMHRYASFEGYDVSAADSTDISSYEDYDTISEYAVPSMKYAVGIGMITGRTNTTLNPCDTAERVEFAAILHRFLEAHK